MTRKLPFMVSLSGPTGAGKSSLGNVLGQRTDLVFVPEPNPSLMLLQMLNDNTARAVDVQNCIINERRRTVSQALATATAEQTIVVEREIFEDRDVFFQLHYKLGLIDGEELKQLEDSADAFKKEIPEADLILFLLADRATLESRISKRPESSWLIKNIELQMELYKKYASRLEKSARHVRFLNTSDSHFDGLLWWL